MLDKLLNQPVTSLMLAEVLSLSPAIHRAFFQKVLLAKNLQGGTEAVNDSGSPRVQVVGKVSSLMVVDEQKSHPALSKDPVYSISMLRT